MSSSPRHSSPSSVSHSDSGSDRDDLLDSSVRFAAHHQQSPLYKRSSHSTNTRTAAVVTASSTELPTKRSTLSAKDAPLASSSGSTTATTIPGASTKTSRLSALSLVADGPYLFVFDVALSLYYPIRAMILFVLGFAFSLIIDHLQTQHQLVEYPNISGAPHIWDTASWVPLTCGAAAVLIGTIYPLGDYLWWGRRVQRNNRDWSSVMRCMGGFIGVNYAASKLPWTSSLQVSCTLALISAGLWFLFDRTFHGFMISLTVASLGTTVAYFLVLNGWYSFTRADFFGVGSWMPCILYSSSVCFGSIGRQLDVVPETWYRSNGTDTTHRKSE
ncbi:Insulin-induced protein 1 protein [Dissophora globulifera]|nr:Insulin-induced protein 1 protein [Dissophora globulifera]